MQQLIVAQKSDTESLSKGKAGITRLSCSYSVKIFAVGTVDLCHVVEGILLGT